MNAEEARNLISEANRLGAASTPREIETLCASVISGLPRNGDGQQELDWSYETLINLKIGEGLFVRALRVFRRYLEDCAPACDPAYDQLYCDALLATGTSPVPFRRRLRFFSLVQLLRRTLPLEGLVAECGCFRGLSSYVLCSSLKLANHGYDGSGYRIFDSFAGLSEPQPEDAIAESYPEAERLRLDTRPGKFAASLGTVKKALGAFPGIEYFPGWIPAAFPDEPGARYRFVHLDVDLYQPTRDGLEYFYPRLAAGGIIVSDDYNWPGARKALDEFCGRTGVGIEITPHQQAHIVRRA